MTRSVVALFVGSVAFAQRTGTVKGIAIDPAGAGIGDAAVRLSLSPPPGSGRSVRADAVTSTRTAAEGAFRLSGIPPGKYDIAIGSPGFHPFLQHSTEIRGGKTINLGRLFLGVGNACGTSAPYEPPVIEIRSSASGGSRVSGSVYDPPVFREANLGGVTVALTRLQEDLRTVRTKTDSGGRFIFDTVAPGSYKLRASLWGRASFAVDEVPVKAGQETTISVFPMDKCRLPGFCATRTRFRLNFLCE